MRSSIAKLSHRVNVISVGRVILRVHECDGTLVGFANAQNGEPPVPIIPPVNLEPGQGDSCWEKRVSFSHFEHILPHPPALHTLRYMVCVVFRWIIPFLCIGLGI